MTNDFVTKQRYLWQPTSLRLLVEEANSQTARRAVPEMIDGTRMLFPETRVALGLVVRVQSRRLAGVPLMSLLYDPTQGETALSVGATALKALHAANVASTRFSRLGIITHLIRWPRVFLAEMSGRRLLTPAQRHRLLRYLNSYFLTVACTPVLVHGDLQPSHLLVDLTGKSLGIIDLEAMRTGKAATNFAQLWDGYHFAHPQLGCELYQRFVAASPELVDARFDSDVLAELALRCYSHIQAGIRHGNHEMEAKSRDLLTKVLSGRTFDEICMEGCTLDNE